MKVAVIGQGYVGLPLAMAAADAGHEVIGFDTDQRKVASLAAGRSYIEDIPDSALRNENRWGRYTPSSDPVDLCGFDVAVITVPTPLDFEGKPDLSYVESAAETVGALLGRGATVILESTTWPGTTEQIVAPILEKASKLLLAEGAFHLGFSPERIDPGNKTWTFTTTPKVVSGVDEASLARVDAFYASLGVPTVPTTSPKEAELAKIIENTYRHVNIALVNEMARYAYELGIDIHAALRAAASKPFGYKAFTPGAGVGGHCLPIDPTYMSWLVHSATGERFRTIELANEINNSQPEYVVRRLAAGLRRRKLSLGDAHVLVLGYAYKANTADCRETPAEPIVARLLSEGAQVTIYEPHTELTIPGATAVTGTPSPADLAAADAVLIVTGHAAFDYEAVQAHAPYVFDACNRLDRTLTNVEII